MKLKQLIEDLQQLIKDGLNLETECLFKEVKCGACYSIESVELYPVDSYGDIHDPDNEDDQLDDCRDCVVFESWG